MSQGTKTALLRRAIDDLEWALGPGIARIMKSPSGIMLERAKLYSRDSDDQPIPRPGPGCVPIKRQSSEPAYELDDHVLERLSRAMRILRAVESASTEAAAVLSALYGDAGARWGSSALANREVAVWPLSATGRGFVETLRVQFHTSAGLRGDELLGREVELQKRQPNDIRRKRLERIERETSDMVERAHAALAEVVCRRAARS